MDIAMIQDDYVFRTQHPMIVGVKIISGEFKVNDIVKYNGKSCKILQMQDKGVDIKSVKEGDFACWLVDVMFNKKKLEIKK